MLRVNEWVDHEIRPLPDKSARVCVMRVRAHLCICACLCACVRDKIHSIILHK